MKKSFIFTVIILSILGAFGFWYYSKINSYKQAQLRRQQERQRVMSISENEQQKQQEKPFDKKYTVIYEEDLSSPQMKKYAQHIYVPLGLSSKDLKLNLEHAAKALKRAKNADSIFIFAYRQDDRKHESGYTAGRYVIAPNIPDTFDIAEVYTKTKKIYPAASEAVINKDDVNLYSRYDFEPSDVVVKLKAGTEVMILEHYRDFAITDIVDIYKVLVEPRKNKKSQYIGWIIDTDIDDIKYSALTKNQISTESINKQNQIKTSISKKSKLEKLLLTWSKNILDIEKPTIYWIRSNQEKKIATCGLILSTILTQRKLKVSILNEVDLENHAKMLTNGVDGLISIFSQYNYDYYSLTIKDVIFMTIILLEWT